MSHLQHKLKLAPRVLLRHRLAAAAAAREAALGADAELVEGDMLRGGVDPSFQRFLVLELRRLGAHQAEDDALALGQEAQRREIAGALGVVLEAVSAGIELDRKSVV